ncbi:hypothetical protein L6Q21_08655 [Sandaracinobacter sp. RS1-74]|uniref:hypothetical protein n=1 Tax=Sandaracinobacteroides sayramensis TaxID=2913411 RepID=UPI001EDBCE6A|nr:hypothetical protein [Sandaracinobacteroides sayramensis]MCG2841051.1 hypothetical protein [Sandaracinobacteroides sayramensis]
MSQWELLVTEGHVRAAKWRQALPWLLGISIAATILGIGLSGLARWPQPSAKVTDAKAAYTEDMRSAVTAFFENPADIPPLSRENATQAPTPDALDAHVADILDTLNRENGLPDSVVVQDADTFWRGAWKPDAVHAVRDGSTILIGGTANTAYRGAPDLRRGYWILRKSETTQAEAKGWTLHCLAAPEAQPCRDESVYPASIPATMRGLLPPSAFEARR